MYIIQLINPLKQFGKYNCSLIFHDDTGELPDGRWEKKYPLEVTKAQLIADLKITLKDFAETNGVSWADAKANGATITIDLKGGTKTIYTI